MNGRNTASSALRSALPAGTPELPMALTPNPTRTRRLLTALGPFFGLVLVVMLFVVMLAIKDVSDEMSRGELKGWAGWTAAAKACPFDGLKAFTSVANLKT